jgi:hypothetical protein
MALLIALVFPALTSQANVTKTFQCPRSIRALQGCIQIGVVQIIADLHKINVGARTIREVGVLRDAAPNQQPNEDVLKCREAAIRHRYQA